MLTCRQGTKPSDLPSERIRFLNHCPKVGTLPVSSARMYARHHAAARDPLVNRQVGLGVFGGDQSKDRSDGQLELETVKIPHKAR